MYWLGAVYCNNRRLSFFFIFIANNLISFLLKWTRAPYVDLVFLFALYTSNSSRASIEFCWYCHSKKNSIHAEVLRSLCVCYRTFLLTLIFILTKPLGCICTRMLIILVLLISWLTWLSIRQSHLIGIRKQTSCSFIHTTHFYTMVHVGDAGDETHGSEHFPSKFNPFIKLGLEWFENSGWCLTFEGWMAVAIFKLYWSPWKGEFCVML